MKKSYTIGTILTLAGASFWGLCAVVGKYLMSRGIDTLWMVDYRMLSAGLIMLAYAIIKNPHGFCDIWKDARSVARLLVVSVFGFGVCQVTYFLAIKYSNAGIAVALQQTAPVFVLVFVIIKERRLPRLIEVLVLALVTFGSFFLATGGDFGQLSISALALLFGMISALTCTIYIMLPGKLIERYGNFETIGWGLSIVGVLLIPVSHLFDYHWDFDYKIALGLAFIVIIGAVAAFGCFLYGATIIGAVRAGVYGLIEPVVATFGSLIFLGQHFSLSDYIGIAAIIAGITILTLSKEN